VQSLPDASGLPVAQAAPAGGAATAAQLLRQQPPGATGAEDEDDPTKSSAVGDAGPPARGLGLHVRQEGFDGLPKVIGDKRLGLHE
jgi:hypothetical protein